MKKISILALSAAFLFAACAPKYNPNDARTFGLAGDVKEVRFSEEMLAMPLIATSKNSTTRFPMKW